MLPTYSVANMVQAVSEEMHHRNAKREKESWRSHPLEDVIELHARPARFWLLAKLARNLVKSRASSADA